MQLIKSVYELKEGDKIKIQGYESIDNNQMFTVDEKDLHCGLITKEGGGWILNVLINIDGVKIYKVSTGKTHLPAWW